MEEPGKQQDDNRRRSFRLGELSEELNDCAKRHNVSASVIIRHALRTYLDTDNNKNLSIESTREIITALENFRIEFSRIGGNLNQIAHAFNIDERMLNVLELATAHKELKNEFSKLSAQLHEIRNALKLE